MANDERDVNSNQWDEMMLDKIEIALSVGRFAKYIASSHTAFEGMFAQSVVGAGERTYVRTAERAGYLPTDEQAEVLVPDRVVSEDILGIAVKDES